jgi:hypothetical protein
VNLHATQKMGEKRKTKFWVISKLALNANNQNQGLGFEISSSLFKLLGFRV